MTKRIRIENADNNTAHKLIAEIYDKGADGAPDVLVDSRNLLNPTDLVDICIHSTRYVVVKELPTA